MIHADDIHVGVSRIEGTARVQVIRIDAGRGKIPRLEIEDIVEPPNVAEMVDHVSPDPAIVPPGHVRGTPPSFGIPGMHRPPKDDDDVIPKLS
jgi:hypothetical protein